MSESINCVACLAEASVASDRREDATLTLLALMIVGGFSAQDIAAELCAQHGDELTGCVHKMLTRHGGDS